MSKKIYIISLVIITMLGISLYKNYKQHQDIISGIILQYIANQEKIHTTLDGALKSKEELGDYLFLLSISRAQGVNNSNIKLLGNATYIGRHLMYEGINIPNTILDLDTEGSIAMFTVYENTYKNKLTAEDIKRLKTYVENLELILKEFKYDGKSTEVFEKSPKELAEKMNRISKELQFSYLK